MRDLKVNFYGGGSEKGLPHFINTSSSDFNKFFKYKKPYLVLQDYGYINDQNDPFYGAFIGKYSDSDPYTNPDTVSITIDNINDLGSMPVILFIDDEDSTTLPKTTISSGTFNQRGIRVYLKKTTSSDWVELEEQTSYIYDTGTVDGVERGVLTLFKSDFGSGITNNSKIRIDIVDVYLKDNDESSLFLKLDISLLDDTHSYSLDESSIDSFEFTKDLKQSDTIGSGVQCNNGSLSFYDDDYVMKAFLEDNYFDEKTCCSFVLDSNIIGEFISSNWVYNPITKKVDITLSDTLERFRDTPTSGMVVVADDFSISSVESHDTSTSMVMVLEYLEDFFFKNFWVTFKYSDYVLQYLAKIRIPYYQFEGSNMFDVLDNFAKSCNIICYSSTRSEIVFELFDEREVDLMNGEVGVYDMNKIVGDVDYDIITRNKINSISAESKSPTKKSDFSYNVSTFDSYSYTERDSNNNEVTKFTISKINSDNILPDLGADLMSYSRDTNNIVYPFYIRYFNDIKLSNGLTSTNLQIHPVFKRDWFVKDLGVRHIILIPMVCLENTTLELDSDVYISSLGYEDGSGGKIELTTTGYEVDEEKTNTYSLYPGFVSSSIFNRISFANINTDDYTNKYIELNNIKSAGSEYWQGRNFASSVVNCGLNSTCIMYINKDTIRTYDNKVLIDVKILRPYSLIGGTGFYNGTFTTINFDAYTQTYFKSNVILSPYKIEKSYTTIKGGTSKSASLDLRFNLFDRVYEHLGVSRYRPYVELALSEQYEYYREGVKYVNFTTVYSPFKDIMGIEDIVNNSGRILTSGDFVKLEKIKRTFKIINSRVIYDGSLKIECKAENNAVINSFI